MIQKGLVPMQADFTKLNPKIPSLLPDNMEISATTQSLGNSTCLNNYGAASSNAAMIICRPPTNPSKIQSYVSSQISKPPRKYPIRLSANPPGSLRAYCAALCCFLNTRTTRASSATNIANLAYDFAHRANFSLVTSMETTVSSLSELSNSISAYESGSKEPQSQSQSTKRAIVLCFGG